MAAQNQSRVIVPLSGWCIAFVLAAWHIQGRWWYGDQPSVKRQTDQLSDHEISVRFQDIPQNLSWIDVSAEEREATPQCTGPLEHCCIGQCRIGKHWIPKGTKQYNQLFVKPDDPNMADMSGLLRVLHESTQHLDLPWCALWFVGDSTTSDHAAAALCQLSELGFGVDGCKDMKLASDKYGNDFYFCDEERFSNSSAAGAIKGTTAMMSSSNPYCNKMRVRFTPHFRLDSKESLAATQDEAGVIVMSHGVHCKDRDCMPQFMNTTFLSFLKNVESPRYSYMWREHEPQHFPTSNGLYVRGVGAVSCKTDLTDYDNFRNEVAKQFLTEHDLLSMVPVVPLYDALKPVGRLHFGVGDCTHYCYSPWRFHVTWNGIAVALQRLHRN